MEYLIKNATIVNAENTSHSDILIEDKCIRNVGKINLKKTNKIKEIDGSDLLAFPGGIDPHVHLQLPTPAGCSSDNFYTGSIAALTGGTTTLFDFVTPHRGQSLLEALELRQAEAAASIIDCYLHLGISEYNSRVAKEIDFCVKKKGIKSFKAYLAYRKSIGINYADLEKLMMQLAGLHAVLLIHCEDGEAIEKKQVYYLSKNCVTPEYHALSRSPKTESDAVEIVLALAKKTKCITYLVHISTRKSAELIHDYKLKNHIYAETCPQYLFLNSNLYKGNARKALKYVISPPLRSNEHLRSLWNHISADTFDIFSTDHCPFNTRGQKNMGINDFTKIPNGAGGVEYRMQLLFTYGVLTNRISLQQFVSLTSTNAAKIFGLYPHKGCIKAGADADLVLWNPTIKSVISQKTQLQHCDSNIFEGFEVCGKPEIIFHQGKMISSD
jgi:dihydropyrimidinase